MRPRPFLPKHLFCLSHRKTHWTMLMNNACLKICLLGTSNSMVTLTIFLDETEVVPKRVQQPIRDFTRPWDDFMVHGVNNPYLTKDIQVGTMILVKGKQ